VSLGSYITKQRNNYSAELNNDLRYWSLSALALSYYQTITPIIRKYVHGLTLDAGAGRLNGKMLLNDYCSDYVSMDINNINGMIKIISDVQDMATVKDNTFDTVYSSQVLEHVPRPWDALSEMHRVLKSGGYAIISVPLFNGLHEEPHDYYRYTPYGLKYLMEQAGFTVVHEGVAGGLFSFLSHIFSLLINCLFWPIPVVRWIVWWLNKLLIVRPVIWFEQLYRVKRKYPASIIMVGTKN
jgi:SAM-dependent methyltransferase